MQDKSKQDKDSVSFEKNLPRYTVDPCIYDLLDAVVKADKNEAVYDPNKFCYSVTFYNKKGNQGSLNILTQQWLNAKDLDCSGFIKIGKMTFLLRGEFKNSKLFHADTSGTSRIILKQLKQKDTDSFYSEPVLTGAYYDCNQFPLYIEVFIKNNVPGFKMDVKNGHSTIVKVPLK